MSLSEVPDPDWATEPDPASCRHCQDLMPYVWVRKFKGWGWCLPNAHEACVAIAAREQHRKAQRRASMAVGVPRGDRNTSLSAYELQEADDPDWMFMRRMARKPHLLGVLHQNWTAYRTIQNWDPAGGRWLYVEGAHGRGKSTLAMALANRLCSPPKAEQWTNPDGSAWVMGRDSMRPGHRRKVAPQLWPVLYIDWPELDARIGLAWERDRAPLAQVAKQRCLILDDLPTGLTKAKSEVIEQLITARYRDRLPTVITSNEPYWQAVDHDRPTWGPRVADRLLELADNVTLGGPSWRDPPSPPEEPRNVVPIDQKTKAAEQRSIWDD
jgi:DNA replication protein DnaC